MPTNTLIIKQCLTLLQLGEVVYSLSPQYKTRLSLVIWCATFTSIAIYIWKHPRKSMYLEPIFFTTHLHKYLPRKLKLPLIRPKYIVSRYLEMRLSMHMSSFLTKTLLCSTVRTEYLTISKYRHEQSKIDAWEPWIPHSCCHKVEFEILLVVRIFITRRGKANWRDRWPWSCGLEGNYCSLYVLDRGMSCCSQRVLGFGATSFHRESSIFTMITKQRNSWTQRKHQGGNTARLATVRELPSRSSLPLLTT